MTKKAIITGLIGLIFLSCDTNDQKCRGTEIYSPIIEAAIVGNIKTGFAAGDRIGVFPVDYVDGVPGIPGDIRNDLNVEYIFDGRYWSAADGEGITLEANMTDIYAYYPYDPGISSVAGKTDIGAYPFDLSGDQAQKKTDFLWAKATAVTAVQNRAMLIFSHVFTRFIINLNYNDSDPVDAMLEVHNTHPHVTIDLRDGSVTRDTDRAEIIPVLLENTTPGYDLSYSAIIAPGFIPEGTPIFSMENNGDTSLFYLSSDVEFRAGFTYTFNIIIGSATTEPENPPVSTF